MTILVAVIVLGILIIVHEFGHFIVAKSFNVGVLDFSIGFGKKLWKKRIGETAYSVGLIPLGGYVRMVGDDPGVYHEKESAPENEPAEELDPVEKKLLADKSRWFLEKGILPRASIVLAGPMFNLFFAVILAVFSFYVYGKGVAVDEPVIGNLVPGLPAEKAGLKPGDRVKQIDGQAIGSWGLLARTISSSGGRELTLAIERKEPQSGNPSSLEIKITGEPESAEMKLIGSGNPGETSYKIGVGPEIRREPATFREAVLGGVGQTWFISVITVKGMWGMIRGAISPRHIAGPIFIFKEAAQSARRGLEYLLDFIVFLSISLAILNLLPVPVLDGGHLAFFALEALRGKPLSMRVQELANQVGMGLLLLLMVFALGNDILRLFS